MTPLGGFGDRLRWRDAGDPAGCASVDRGGTLLVFVQRPHAGAMYDRPNWLFDFWRRRNFAGHILRGDRKKPGGVLALEFAID